MSYKTVGKRWGSLLASALGLAGLFLSVPVWAVTFSPPEGVSGTPQTETSGGATRGDDICLVDYDSDSKEQPEDIARLQLNEEPTFVVYVPQSTAKEALFVLQDDSKNMIYETKVPLPEEGEIISIPLTKNLADLEIGKDYKWFLIILCLGEFTPEDPIFEGWVQAI